MNLNSLFSVLNAFTFIILISVTYNSVKNIDNHADALIKLSGCRHTLKYQDQVLRELIALDHIYEEE